MLEQLALESIGVVCQWTTAAMKSTRSHSTQTCQSSRPPVRGITGGCWRCLTGVADRAVSDSKSEGSTSALTLTGRDWTRPFVGIMLHVERVHMVTAACNVRWAASLRWGLDHLLALGAAFLEIVLVQLEEIWGDSFWVSGALRVSANWLHAHAVCGEGKSECLCLGCWMWESHDMKFHISLDELQGDRSFKTVGVTAVESLIFGAKSVCFNVKTKSESNQQMNGHW